MKTDFIILGAQKCATTTLFEMLDRSPRIVGAADKEPHFFSTCSDWRAELPRYEALFERKDGALYCEASTSYTFYPHRNLEIWEDLHEYNPRMKFIYIVRNPIDRILSSYLHNLARGYTRDPVETYVRSHALPIDVSRYHMQIVPFVRRFGRDRVLLLDFADLVANPRATLSTVAGFLGLDVAELEGAEDVHANVSIGGRKQHHRFDRPPLVMRGVRKLLPGTWAAAVAGLSPKPTRKPELPPHLKRMIVNLLDSDIAALERLTDRDFADWRRTDGAARAAA